MQHDFVGAWVNSTKSLRPLPAFCLCCVVCGCSVTCGCVGKFRTIVAAVAGLLFVLCLGRWCTRLVVGAWVNSAKSLRLLPAFVCVVFGPMVQRNFVGNNRCDVSCFNFWPTASCTPRVRCLAQRSASLDSAVPSRWASKTKNWTAPRWWDGVVVDARCVVGYGAA